MLPDRRSSVAGVRGSVDMSAAGSTAGSSGAGPNKSKKGDVTREEVNDLHGKVNSVRTQITQLNHKIGKIPALDNDAKLDSVQRQLGEMKQMAAQSAQMTQEMAYVKAEVQQVAALRNENAQMKQQLAQMAPLMNEVAQLKQQLAQATQMNRDLDQVKQQLAQSAQLANELNQLKQQVAQSTQLQNKVTQLERELAHHEQTKQELRSMKDEVRQATSAVRDVQKLKGDVSAAQRSAEQATKAVEKTQSLHEEVNRCKQEVNKVTEMKSKIQHFEQKHQQQERKLDQISQKHAHKEVEGHVRGLQQEVGVTVSEFNSLKRTLNDLGVLRPPKVEIPEDVPPPVGTVELGEDCFTARMLLKLGFLKVKQEAMDAASQDEYDDDNDDRRSITLRGRESTKSVSSYSAPSLDGEPLLQNMDNVLGLGTPEVEEGAPGYKMVTRVWFAICAFTLFLQLFIVGCLVWYAQEPTECYDHPPSPSEWWILHLSKGFAVISAGALMLKDIMDIINCWMVSVLLEPHCDSELTIMNFLRITLTIAIGFANVYMFQGMVSPASVWINMAALAFVGELGSQVVDQGKKGVFGHHIRAELTNMNYELTFVADYPWWIPYVQYSAEAGMIVFTVVSAYKVTLDADPMC